LKGRKRISGQPIRNGRWPGREVNINIQLHRIHKAQAGPGTVTSGKVTESLKKKNKNRLANYNSLKVEWTD